VERRCLPIEGFDLGNSPTDFTGKRVRRKTVVLTTTNGTVAIGAAAGAARLLVGSWLNFQAVVDELVRGDDGPVLLCAGKERAFALEDAVLAGRMARAVMAARPGEEWELNDGALAALELAERFGDQAELFNQTHAGRDLIAAELAPDLKYCARMNRHAVVPVLQDRQLVLLPKPAPAPV